MKTADDEFLLTEGQTTESENNKERPASPVYEKTEDEVTQLESRRRYVITAAQNNTAPNLDFLRALEYYSELTDAQFLIKPIRYKNPTSRLDPQEGENNPEYWWHEALQPYLIDTDLQLHEQLVLQASVGISATSPNPLSGTIDALSKDKSAIYGHSQLAMKSVPTPQHKLPKLLYTTGSVTEKNYSSTVAGARAHFNHSYSAVIVETDGEHFHIRDINWDGECFYDFNPYCGYAADGCFMPERAEAIVPGDIHAWFHNPEVFDALYGAINNVCDRLEPKRRFLHDLVDSYSISHWHQGHTILEYVKNREGKNSLEDELNDTIKFVNETGRNGMTDYIVSSNHGDHLTRWLDEGESRVEHENLLLYLELKAAILRDVDITESGKVTHPNPFAVFAEGKWRDVFGPVFLGSDDSCLVHGIEYGMHGHLGLNGARGNVQGFARMGVRSVTGHTHSPMIFKGLYVVGTSSHLNLDYTRGPSSWLNSFAVQYPNGELCLIHIINGRCHS